MFFSSHATQFKVQTLPLRCVLVNVSDLRRWHLNIGHVYLPASSMFIISLALGSTGNIVHVAWINMDSCKEALFHTTHNKTPSACWNAMQNCHYLHKSSAAITPRPPRWWQPPLTDTRCSVTRCFAVDCGKTSMLQSTRRPSCVQATEMSPLDDAWAFESHRAYFHEPAAAWLSSVRFQHGSNCYHFALSCLVVQSCGGSTEQFKQLDAKKQPAISVEMKQ